jgi:hypothetical protein
MKFFFFKFKKILNLNIIMLYFDCILTIIRKCPSKQLNTTYGVNAWVNAQGFATWQIFIFTKSKTT